ncbi:MAG: IMP cyclohydrolase [Anaerovoracaceae bacterium]
MSVYTINNLKETLESNTYGGRGIVIGKTPDGTKAAIAYFIMGRNENSRNRIFIEEGDEVIINAFDPSKLEDPSLIIYSPIKVHENKTIVTNGDQTDTVYDFIVKGDTFENALDTREFEPDGPNWTPRISGMLTFDDGDFSYKMSILKSGDSEGTICNRYYYNYKSLSGLGHYIHTYQHDGNPIPTFCGEPERVAILDDIDEFADMIWNSLNEANKVSMYVRYIDLATGKIENRMVNKNK